jgi:hypothetical protein
VSEERKTNAAARSEEEGLLEAACCFFLALGSNRLLQWKQCKELRESV